MANPPYAIVEVLNTYVANASGGPNLGWTDVTGDTNSVVAEGLGWVSRRAGNPTVGKLELHLNNLAKNQNSGTTLNGTITAAATTLVVNNANAFFVGQMIYIDTEYMQITAISSVTLTVTRGVNFSSAAAHTNGATVYIYAPLYTPRSTPGSYTLPALGSGYFEYLMEVGDYVRVRYCGLNSGRCMRAAGTSTLNVPSSGTIAQTLSEAIVNGQTWTLTFQARAQYDYQNNTDSVILSTNSGAGTLDSSTTAQTYTNKWATYTATLTTTQTATTIVVTFSPWVSVAFGGYLYLEYRNVTLTCPSISSGANQIVNGTFQSGALGSTPTSWSVVAGSNGMTGVVADDTLTRFYGRIKDVQPQPFISQGTDPTCIVIAEGLFSDIQQASISPPPTIQHNVATNALISLALTFVTRTWPGQTLDAGRLTPPGTSFDKYTSGTTKVSMAIDDVLLSEFGKVHFDLDGTFVFHNRDYEAKKTALSYSPALVLNEGQAYNLVPVRSRDTLINRVYITFHPRTTINPLNPLFIAKPPVQIPAKGPNGPGQLTVTAQFHDLYGRPCGADNIRQLIPWVSGRTDYDYQINEFQAGNGIDYTTNSNVTVSMTVGASQATIVFSNNAIGPLWIQSLRIMGRAITTYDPQWLRQGEGTQATGSIAAASQPVNLDTVVVNGTTYTFVTALTPTAGQILIGANTLASMQNLYNAMVGGPGAGLNYANLTTLAPATALYTQPTAANSNTISITYLETGTAGNNFTLAKTGTGGVSVSGTKLTGGASNSKTLYGLQDYSKDLPFTDDPVFVQNLATWLIYRLGYAFLEIQQLVVEFEEQLSFNSTATVSTFGVTGGGTTVTLSSALPFAAGMTILIDSEYMWVSSVDYTNKVLSVIRGWNNSTATTHAIGAAIYVYVDLMSLEIGDVIAVNSLQNGMFNARHLIASINKYELNPKAGAHPLQKITFDLARLDQRPVAIWNEINGSTWGDGVSVAYI